MKFRFHLYLHVFNVFSIMFCLGLYFLFKIFLGGRRLDIVLILMALLGVFNLINFLYASYTVDENGLKFKTLVGEQNILWGEVKGIIRQPAGRLVRISIAVYGENEKVIINPWINKYTELTKFIIGKCKTNENVQIDPNVINNL